MNYINNPLLLNDSNFIAIISGINIEHTNNNLDLNKFTLNILK
jgi:hypothetical protein